MDIGRDMRQILDKKGVISLQGERGQLHKHSLCFRKCHNRFSPEQRWPFGFENHCSWLTTNFMLEAWILLRSFRNICEPEIGVMEFSMKRWEKYHFHFILLLSGDIDTIILWWRNVRCFWSKDWRRLNRHFWRRTLWKLSQQVVKSIHYSFYNVQLTYIFEAQSHIPVNLMFTLIFLERNALTLSQLQVKEDLACFIIFLQI